MSLKLDTPHFVNGDVAPFYGATPPPPLLHVSRDQFYHHLAYLEDELWHNNNSVSLPHKKRSRTISSTNSDPHLSPPSFKDETSRPALTSPLELDLDNTSTRKRHEKHLTRQASYSELHHDAVVKSQGLRKIWERSQSQPTSRRTSPLGDGQPDYRDIGHKTSPSREGHTDYRDVSSMVTKHRSSISPQNNGMMETAGDQEGVINLSTVTKDGPSPRVHNGDALPTDTAQPESQGPPLLPSPQAKPSSGSGAAKRKTKSNSMVELGTGSVGPHPSLMMMAAAQHAQHGLMPQQMQQLLQQQSQGLSPQQLQQIMQHQSMMLQHQQQKLQDQVLQELNEQLQMNILQQSQLMQQQPDKSKMGKSQLQQLAVQQQQLVQQIQQIQIQQRQYLLACLVQPFGVPQGMMSPGEIQQLWKEVASQSGLDDSLMKNNVNGAVSSSLSSGLTSLPTPPTSWTSNGIAENYLSPGNCSLSHSSSSIKQEQASPTSSFHALLRHSLCKWPGCDMHCEDYSSFLKHMSAEHTLDDRSTAQARVQMQVVSQLEIQLTREKDLLQEMMKHLHMMPTDSKVHSSSSVSSDSSQKPLIPKSPPVASSTGMLLSQLPSPHKHISVSSPLKLPHLHLPLSASAPPTPVGMIGNPMSLPLIIPPPIGQTPISKPSTPLSQASSLPTTPTSAGPMRRRVSDKCNLPISAEIQRNRDFYKSTDVRPPFTYASLIRQAIIESPHKQLTLNEIYQWFQNTFAYFRRNEATWKNAVRHNLSLHKCFMRVENVKGAVWTVDEVEFYKRRPQKLGGSMSKSPSMQSEHSVFGDNLNASLRVALEQANSMMNHQFCNGTMSVDGVEDLSMKTSRNSSSESLAKLELPTRDELLGLKTEPDLEPEIYLENGHSPHLAEEEEEEDMHDLDDDLAGSEEEEEEEEEQAAMDTTSDTQRSIQSVSPYGQLSTNQELYLQSLQQQAQHQDGLLLPPVMSTMAS